MFSLGLGIAASAALLAVAAWALGIASLRWCLGGRGKGGCGARGAIFLAEEYVLVLDKLVRAGLTLNPCKRFSGEEVSGRNGTAAEGVKGAFQVEHFQSSLGMAFFYEYHVHYLLRIKVCCQWDCLRWFAFSLLTQQKVRYQYDAR